MIDPLETILAASIFIAILALGAVITIGNERVRRATLQVGQVAHDYALTDLAMRRDQARRNINYSTKAHCLQALEQIVLDATKTQLSLTDVVVVPGSVAALIATARDGSQCTVTPAAETFLKSNPAYGRRSVQRYVINSLVSIPFVAEELESIARWHGLKALPRTEEWTVFVSPVEDYSLLPKPGGLSKMFRRS